MKTKIETIFIWIFLLSVLVLGVSYIMLLFNLLKPIFITIISSFKEIAIISIIILVLIWVFIKLRSDYELLILVDGQWKSIGIFDNPSSIYQYIDEHDELEYDDFKIRAIEKRKSNG